MMLSRVVGKAGFVCWLGFILICRSREVVIFVLVVLLSV